MLVKLLPDLRLSTNLQTQSVFPLQTGHINHYRMALSTSMTSNFATVIVDSISSGVKPE